VIRNQAKIEAFGLRLRRLRDERNLSQQELADNANLAKPTIQRIEKGTTSAGLDILLSLAEALNMSLREMIDM
jgi:transcriptional regulator with XRE-family HTH domain